MLRSQLLSIRSFRNLWLGQAISMLGDAFYYVVNAFMVKKLTGSSTLVGLNGALETLPFLLAGPYAGVLADRIDRRKVMLISDLLSFATLLMLAAVIYGTAKPPVEVIMVNAALLSICRVFFTPAKNAAIPRLVPQDMLLRANSFNAATQNVMPMIGLSISAAVLALIYAVSQMYFYLVSVLLNALSFLGSAFFVRKLPELVPDRTEAQETHPLTDFKEGLRYIRSRQVLKVMLLQSLIVNLLISPFFVAYVAMNESWFSGKPQTLSWFEASFFLGMVIASAAVGRLNIKSVGWSSIGGTAAVGVTVALFAITRNVWLMIFWNFLAGLQLPFALIPAQTYMQITVPDELRGRVQSVSFMLSMGVQPVGLSLGGIMVERLGLVASFLIMGSGMIVGVLVGISDKEFRDSRLPQEEPVIMADVSVHAAVLPTTAADAPILEER